MFPTSTLLLLLAFGVGPGRGRGSPIKATSLYDKKDPITQLDKHSFGPTVYGRNKAFFVEFYSSWCGGCIAYAPKFKAIARSLAPWAAAVEVASVNCADDLNTDLCQAHEIDSFPTLKYFKYQSLSEKDGVKYSEERQQTEKVAANVAFLAFHDWRRQEPPNWPAFTRAPDTQRIQDLFSTHASWTHIALVVEDPSDATMTFVTPLAAALTLDWASVPALGVVSARSTHPSIGGQVSDLPGLLVFKKGDPEPVFVSRKKIGVRAELSARIADATDLIQPPDARSLPAAEAGVRGAAEPAQAAAPPAADTAAPLHVDVSAVNQFQAHMGDLTTGLRYLLHKEVGLKKELSPANVQALSRFLTLLSTHFPGLPPVRRLLYRLSKQVGSLAESGAGLAGAEWAALLDKEEEDLGRPLPTEEKWTACQSSDGKHRGYPCALWTIFHSLTVAVYKADAQKDRSFDPRPTLEAIRGYVLNFFGCAECVTHFEQHAAKIQQDARAPEDVVLWLWGVHNKANERTKGTLSEDPAFPKLQFPPPNLCSKCYASDGNWDKGEVLKYLLRFFSEDIVLDSSGSPYKVVGFDAAGKKSVESKRLDLNPKFRGRGERVAGLEKREEMLRRERERWEAADEKRWGTGATDPGLDLSFCFSVWAASMALVGLVYVYLRFRRVRHRYFKTSERRV